VGTINFLLNDLVGASDKRRRHIDTERPGGLQVDYKLELDGLLDRQISGVGTL
jgi:hypothetical protein